MAISKPLNILGRHRPNGSPCPRSGSSKIKPPSSATGSSLIPEESSTAESANLSPSLQVREIPQTTMIHRLAPTASSHPLPPRPFSAAEVVTSLSPRNEAAQALPAHSRFSSTPSKASYPAHFSSELSVRGKSPLQQSPQVSDLLKNVTGVHKTIASPSGLTVMAPPAITPSKQISGPSPLLATTPSTICLDQATSPLSEISDDTAAKLAGYYNGDEQNDSSSGVDMDDDDDDTENYDAGSQSQDQNITGPQGRAIGDTGGELKVVPDKEMAEHRSRVQNQLQADHVDPQDAMVNNFQGLRETIFMSDSTEAYVSTTAHSTKDGAGKATLKRQKQGFSDSEPDITDEEAKLSESSGSETGSDDSSYRDRAGVHLKNILSPTARRAAVVAAKNKIGIKSTRVAARAAAKAIRTAPPTPKRRGRPNNKRAAKSALKPAKRQKTRVSSDIDDTFSFPSSPPIPIRSNPITRGPRPTHSSPAYGGELEPTNDIVKTLQDNLRARDKELQSLKKKNEGLNSTILDLSGNLAQSRHQAKVILEGQKSWVVAAMQKLKGGNPADWAPQMAGAFNVALLESVRNTTAFRSHSIAALQAARDIVSGGGPTGMAKHIEGFYVGELSAERSGAQAEMKVMAAMKAMEEMGDEQLINNIGLWKRKQEGYVEEERSTKVTGANASSMKTPENAKSFKTISMRKNKWIIGGIEEADDRAGDQTQEIIDLTMSSPPDRSSLMPTSSPERAEDEIVRVVNSVSGFGNGKMAPPIFRG